MLLCVPLAAALVTACDTAPRFRVLPVTVVKVTLPDRAVSTAPLVVSLRYAAGCGDFRPEVAQSARTASKLVLEVTTQVSVEPPPPCQPVYIEQTLDYTDPGTPARSDPFEVVVNGKSWGTVQVNP